MTAFTLTTPYVRESQVVSPSQMIATGDATLEALPSVWPVLPSDSVPVLGENCIGKVDLSMGMAWPMPMWVEIGIPSPKGRTFDAERALTRRRHSGRFNIGFVDAHVENLKPADLFDLRRDDIRKRWNRDNLPHPAPFPPSDSTGSAVTVRLGRTVQAHLERRLRVARHDLDPRSNNGAKALSSCVTIRYPLPDW